MSTLERRAYAAGHFLFTLDHASSSGGDGWTTSWLRSVDGGQVKTSVLDHQVGPGEVSFKSMGPIEIEPLTVEAGIAASKPILDWIEDSWSRRASYRSGAIQYADFRYKAMIEQSFEEALIEEVTFPTLDGGDKSPAYLTLKIRPTRLTTKAGGGQVLDDQNYGGNKQKLWTPSSFRFRIDGFECDHISRIDSFTIKQKIKALEIGGSRYPELTPIRVEFPNLTVSMSAAHADDFIQWHDEEVVKDQVEHPGQGRTGVIEFLDSAAATDQVLFSVKLERVGICGLAFDKSEAGSEQIKRCKVELFVDQMHLEPGVG